MKINPSAVLHNNHTHHGVHQQQPIADAVIGAASGKQQDSQVLKQTETPAYDVQLTSKVDQSAPKENTTSAADAVENNTLQPAEQSATEPDNPSAAAKPVIPTFTIINPDGTQTQLKQMRVFTLSDDALKALYAINAAQSALRNAMEFTVVDVRTGKTTIKKTATATERNGVAKAYDDMVKLVAEIRNSAKPSANSVQDQVNNTKASGTSWDDMMAFLQNIVDDTLRHSYIYTYPQTTDSTVAGQATDTQPAV